MISGLEFMDFSFMRVLKKIITREAPLIVVEGWYDGMTRRFQECFGMSYVENVFLFRNDTVESYRDIIRLEEELPREYAEWIAHSRDRLPLVYQPLADAVAHSKGLDLAADCSVDAVLGHLHEVHEWVAQGLPALFCTLWLPIYHERHRERYDEDLFPEDVVHEAVRWREGVGDVFFNANVDAVFLLLNHISQQFGWDVSLLKNLTLDELREGVVSGVLPDDAVLRQKNAFVYVDSRILHLGALDLFLAQRGFRIEQDKIFLNTAEIKGVTGNPGVARGTVRKIYSRSQLDMIGEGDILVAPMTSPWYMPAIKKACAIITDEGGVTCHAAIVSRELGIPAVIGTKIATQVLRDGDRVEVDAYRGVVIFINE